MRSLVCLLLLAMASVACMAQHNYLYEPTQCYEGTIGERKVVILFQNYYGNVHGFLMDAEHPVPLLLRAWGDGRDSLIFYEYYHETGEAYLIQPDDSANFLTGMLRVGFEGDAMKGTWSSTDGKQRLPVACHLKDEPAPSPETIKQLLETGDLKQRVTTLSRWLCGAAPGVHLTHPMPYVGTSYFPEDEETTVQLKYQQLFGDERKEAILQVNVGNYRTQVFVLLPTANGWQPWGEYLHFGEMQGYTSCLYCTEQKEYSKVNLFQACGGTWCVETINCGGECKDGSSRGDYVTRDLYRIAESGFQDIFYDQLEHEYRYESPCPAPVEAPKHVEFTYLTPQGEKYPTQVKLTHVEFEPSKSKHKMKEGDCPEEDIYVEGDKIEEIIELCE